MNFLKQLFSCTGTQTLMLTLVFGVPFAANAADRGKSFATPEEAVAALVTAASAKDTGALRVIFGPAAEDLQNADRVQATNDFNEFITAFHKAERITRTSDAKCVLEVGEHFWPFPVPIVKQDGRWYFDTAAGANELINRRIGKNELSTLQSVRAYVEAQREYASRDRDGDEVLEYAQKLSSAAGQKDGLYWPVDLDGETSPLGPLVAEAQMEGYLKNPGEKHADPKPFHGYFFKLLTSQGKSAPGGKYDYVANRNMVGGFALVAWPAEYGETGIMTFIVNQQGRVYQKDLGAKTGKIAAKIRSYDPDKTWTIARD